MNKQLKQSTGKSLDMLLQLDLDILAIGAVKDLTSVLENVAQATWDFLGGTFCVVQPYEQSSDSFLLHQFTVGGDIRAKKFTWTEPRKEGSARTTLKEGLLLIEDYHRQEYLNKYPFLEGSIGAFREVLPVKATIGIRLDAGDETVGIIFVNYSEPQDFAPEKIDLAKQFATRAAYAIRNARLYDKSLKVNRLLTIANKLTALIGEPDEIMHTALEEAVKMIGMDRGGIVLHEGTGGRLAASYPRTDGVQVVFGDTRLQRKVREIRNPIEIYDVISDENLDIEEKKNFIDRGIKSSLITPLIAQDKVIGSLGLDDTTSYRHFSDSEKEFVKLIADVIATSIDSARLYANVITVSGNILRRALHLDTSRNEFYQFVIQETLSLMDFDAGWLLEKEGERVRIVMTDDEHQGDIGRHFDINKSISGKCVIRKETILINDLDNIEDEELRPLYQAPIGKKIMKSELVVPLLIGTEVIGAFDIETDKKNAFRSRHIEILKLLSDQIAHAIELTRLRETTRLLSNLELELSRKTEMAEVLDAILNGAIKLIHEVSPGYGQILLLEGNKLITRYTTNPPKETGDLPDDLNKEYNIEDCNSGIAVSEKQPIIFPRIDEPEYYVVSLEDSEYGRQGVTKKQKLDRLIYQRALELEKEKIIAEYAIPIITNDDKVIGVFNFETPNKEGFSQKETERLDKQIYEISNKLVLALEQLDKILLSQLLNTTLKIAQTKFGQILRLAEESKGEELVIEATTGGEPLYTRVRVSDSITGRCVLTKKPVYIPDVSKDSQYQRYLGEEIKSELVIPLLFENKVIGVLNLESPLRSFYTINHAITLETFAAQATVAIDRAKKFQGITLSEIGAIAGDVVHRLNNPLGAIGGRIELFKKKYEDKLNSDQYLSQFIQRTERDLKDSKDIIQELRKTYKKGAPTPTNLYSAVKSGIEKAELPEFIKTEVIVDENIQVIATERLSHVLWNLFTNAQKAITKAKRVIGVIQIAASNSKDGWTHINIKDNGIGISPAQLDLIWDPDVTTTSEPNAPAHGLGLYWTKAMVESYGGEIFAQSESGVGTLFTIRLRSVSGQ